MLLHLLFVQLLVAFLRLRIHRTIDVVVQRCMIIILNLVLLAPLPVLGAWLYVVATTLDSSE